MRKIAVPVQIDPDKYAQIRQIVGERNFSKFVREMVDIKIEEHFQFVNVTEGMDQFVEDIGRLQTLRTGWTGGDTFPTSTWWDSRRHDYPALKHLSFIEVRHSLEKTGELNK